MVYINECNCCERNTALNKYCPKCKERVCNGCFDNGLKLCRDCVAERADENDSLDEYSEEEL